MVRIATLLALALTAMLPGAPFPAAPTFQDLMAPESFPNPQRGLVVAEATLRAGVGRVVTTGAEITIKTSTGEILLAQRIGSQRPLVRLRLGKALQGGELTHSGKGFARFTFTSPKLTIRVNGDSLFMLHAQEALSVPVERLILPAWHASYRSNHLIADELGAFGLYCSQPGISDQFDPYTQTVATYPLPENEVLWVGVCPPKPYDWERSFAEKVVWHWTRGDAYPSDDALTDWSKHGNVVLLQSEVKLWKDWNLAFEPRKGPEEFARVRETVHRLGMRFIVYTSPYYFLKGTSLESRAFNSFEGFKHWPPGTSSGENMGLFLAAIRKVMKEHKPDGLYFDGQYTGNPAALYALAREAREIVGEKGILEWHSTGALGSGGCYLPQADAYVDIILRGEGKGADYGDFDYLRFFVSGYNINNCIGVLCNNGPEAADPELSKQVLAANARYHMLVSRLRNKEVAATMGEHYLPRLKDGLRQEVDAGVARRQQAVEAKVEALTAEIRTLAGGGEGLRQIWGSTFRELPTGTTHVSPQNPYPFRITPDGLRVRAKANTYACYEIPLTGQASALVAKIRQGSEGGQSWGPGVLLRFADKSFIRLGTRSDGKLQADINGRQLHGDTYDPTQWVWLRARWTQNFGVVERSADGKTYTKVWGFEHRGRLTGKTAALMVGKVPFDGKPRDYPVPGKVGESDFGEAQVLVAP
ncbi:MAG: hypothetical protein HN380_11170 [Victivallales bacterium]|nr:hypothetical protein [Victivallales bacterium]